MRPGLRDAAITASAFAGARLQPVRPSFGLISPNGTICSHSGAPALASIVAASVARLSGHVAAQSASVSEAAAMVRAFDMRPATCPLRVPEKR